MRQLTVERIESLGAFRERNSTNRGNAYPPPMQLHPRYVQHSIFSNWDCVPSGGEMMPNENPPARPGCVLAEYTTFQGERQGRFPHVDPANYGR